MGEKRKHSGTPASTEPAGKRNYVETVSSGGAGSVPKPKVHILWVHSSLVEKGDISEGYFNQVISRCNQIKIKGVFNSEAEHDWSPEAKLFASIKKPLTIGLNGFQLPPLRLAQFLAKCGPEMRT